MAVPGYGYFGNYIYDIVSFRWHTIAWPSCIPSYIHVYPDLPLLSYALSSIRRPSPKGLGITHIQLNLRYLACWQRRYICGSEDLLSSCKPAYHPLLTNDVRHGLYGTESRCLAEYLATYSMTKWKISVVQIYVRRLLTPDILHVASSEGANSKRSRETVIMFKPVSLNWIYAFRS